MNSGTVSHNMRPMSLPVSGHVPSPMPASNSFYQDLHTRQTIDRLQCIQKHLKNPAGFVRTASELLEWCSDARAFQGQFHQCLMSCLSVINDVAGKPGFNLEFCYKLIAICHSQKEKFNSTAATMIEVWMQNIQKLRMMHHHSQMDPMQQKNMPPQGVSGSSPLNNMNHSKMGYPQTHMGRRPHESVWNQTGQQAAPHPNQHQSLSVITTATVWGVSATQTPPVPVHSQSSSTSFPHQHMGHPGSHMGRSNIQSNYNNNYANKPNPADSFQNSPMFSSGHRGMPPGRMGPQGHHVPGDQPHHPPAAAAAAAAVAAAAATATATATATVIKEHQDQNQMNSFDQGPVGPMSQTMGDPHMHQSMPPHQQHMPPGSSMHGVPPQAARMRPQMSPQYARAASVPTSFPIPSPRPLTHNGPPMYTNDASYKGSCRPQQGYGQISYNGGHNMENPFNKSSDGFNHVGLHRQASGGVPGYTPRVSGTGQPHIHPNNPQQQYYSYQNQRGQPDSYPQPPSQRPHMPPQYSNEARYSNTQPQMPGNPTPPLTPGSAHNVPPYPNMASIGLSEGNSGLPVSTTGPYFPPPMNTSSSQIDADDLRLSFPVRDGIVLGAFRLQHNLSLSSHAFHLRDQVYRTLSERGDLDLQFKCYHHDDATKHTNWPHSVQVGVNGTQLSVPRGVNRGDHKPLYLKSVCQPGRNAIDINVSSCCCSHFFVLQVVHRPGLQFVLRSLLGKRMLPDVNCRRKIKQNFSNGTISANDAVMPNTSANGAVESLGTLVKISLLCPITYRPIQIPARGQECRHVQCFDLESYLQLNSENATWLCPICHKNALLEVLEVDEFIQNIIKTLKGRDCQLVSIDANCLWKQLPGSIYPGGRPRAGPMDQLPNGMGKHEPYREINVKQEPMSTNNANFSVKQEKPFISALQIKREPDQRGDADAPPSKRMKSAGGNLKGFPVLSPGSAGGFNKLGAENNTGYPPHDFSRFENNAVSSGSHLGGNFIRRTSGIAVKAEMSDQIAVNDMVPIEKRLNTAVTGTDAGLINGGSPYRKRGCPETPKTPQGPKTPMRPPSSSAVLTPQSVNSQSGNCPTPSSMPCNNSNQVKSSTIQCSSSVDAPGSVINPTTPVVSLPSLDQDNLGILDSFFEDNVGCGDEDPASVLAFGATSGARTDKEAQDDLILPDPELLDILPLNELGAVAATSNNITEEDDILSLFDSAT